MPKFIPKFNKLISLIFSRFYTSSYFQLGLSRRVRNNYRPGFDGKQASGSRQSSELEDELGPPA